MEFKTVKQQRLYMQVADQIIGMVREGVISAGSRLPSERDLAEKLGVSRPTIREAMIAMEISGIVEIRSGSGVYVVRKPGRHDTLPTEFGAGPFEILEARLALEGETAALAADKITKQELQRLKKLLADMARENQQESVHEDADEEFHRVIAEASGNSVLVSAVEWLWALRNESEISQMFHRRLREEGVRPIIEDHQSIYDALVEGSASKARKAMHKHLKRVIKTVIESEAT
ncbi:FadR/GntR family transcriptional regulator [Litorivivens sp.]|uniref:FadR/GntR family transcriptional regulator n=1 Tax=Litorivivens sp. TaxID=2020868 RepID=UPI003566AFEC